MEQTFKTYAEKKNFWDRERRKSSDVSSNGALSRQVTQRLVDLDNASKCRSREERMEELVRLGKARKEIIPIMKGVRIHYVIL